MIGKTLIDTTRINSIGGMENPVVVEILERFVADLPERRRKLEAAVAQEDEVELLAILHRLKGAARTCGFEGLARAAADWMTEGGTVGSPLQANLVDAMDASNREWRRLSGR
jgi:hypothetical protein